MWYLRRRYTAHQALAFGLVNAVVPDETLDGEVLQWCRSLMEMSPTALTIAKRSFNADRENIREIGALGFQALRLYYDSEESAEGEQAFCEKRKAQFCKNWDQR